MSVPFCFWRRSVRSRSLDFSVMSAVSRSDAGVSCALRSAIWFSSKAIIFGLSFSVMDGVFWVSLCVINDAGVESVAKGEWRSRNLGISRLQHGIIFLWRNHELLRQIQD